MKPMQRRDWLKASGTGLLLLSVAGPSLGARVLQVRMWPAQAYTRVTIESDIALKTRHQVLRQPSRLVVDIEGIALDDSLNEWAQHIPAKDPYIRGARVASQASGVVRLVIDLKQDVQPQVFSLNPVAIYRHRLVFDLYPLQAVDPLEELLQSKGLAGENDAIADLWQRHLQTQEDGITKSAPAHAASAASSTPSSSKASTSGRDEKPGAGSDRILVIALDPGHGGEDPGAIGPEGSMEKDVVLQIALLLRQRINQQQLRIKKNQQEDRYRLLAYLTRDADYFVPLHERVQKARAVKAELFLSIHADAFLTPAARGASVFALSEKGASSTAARWMAQQENRADLIGGMAFKKSDAQVRKALLDMSTSAQIKDSLKLGQNMLGEMGQVGRLHKASVEQAGFAVLKAPDMPSVLVETAFISNPEEERRLRNPRDQAELADALLRGIVRYLEHSPSLGQNRPRF